MSNTESDVERVSETKDAAGSEETEDEGTVTPHQSHHHRRSNRSEVTNITITPPASPPNEPNERPVGRLGRVRGYVAIAVVTVLIAVCLYGIFTGFGHEKCDCNDLRNYFCGILGACMMFLTGTVKEQFAK